MRYTRFRAPGRYHNGKVTPERIGLGLSEERFVAYCRSGKVKLIDTAFSNPLLSAVDVSVSATTGSRSGWTTTAPTCPRSRARSRSWPGRRTRANIVEELRARLKG